MQRPRLRLPPLPPATAWSRHFPAQKLSHPPDVRGQRNFPGRALLTNRSIADDFVKHLQIRPNEVVIETFGGGGRLTRSLLNGGKHEDIAEKERQWSVIGRAPPKQRLRGVVKYAEVEFPTWLSDIKAKKEKDRPNPNASSGGEQTNLLRPRLVVAAEPSPEYLVRGLGLPQDLAVIKPPNLIKTTTDVDAKTEERYVYHRNLGEDVQVDVYQSEFEPNLLLSPVSPYIWNTIPDILRHELVAPILQHDCQSDDKRPWSAIPPPITIVAQVPDADVGEQMASQWLSSSIGAAEGLSSWIWQWGRINLAMILPKHLYDVSSNV